MLTCLETTIFILQFHLVILIINKSLAKALKTRYIHLADVFYFNLAFIYSLGDEMVFLF